MTRRLLYMEIFDHDTTFKNQTRISFCVQRSLLIQPNSRSSRKKGHRVSALEDTWERFLEPHFCHLVFGYLVKIPSPLPKLLICFHVEFQGFKDSTMATTAEAVWQPKGCNSSVFSMFKAGSVKTSIFCSTGLTGEWKLWFSSLRYCGRLNTTDARGSSSLQTGYLCGDQ